MNWKRFRKKPVIVDAVQWNSDTMKWDDFPEEYWARGPEELWRPFDITGQIGEKLVIRTLNGYVRVSPGEWVIRGVRGELYPCDNDIFQETYDALE